MNVPRSVAARSSQHVRPLPMVLAALHNDAGPFHPAWSVHPSVVIGCAAMALLYAWGVRTLRRGRGEERRLPAWRVLCFSASLLVLLASLNGPLHDLSDDYLFSAHMLQHLLLQLVWPPLLLAGLPDWLVEPLFRRPVPRRIARILTQPVVAGALFGVTIAAFHVPALYDVMMEDHNMHIAIHLLFMGTALFMWWPVLSPTPLVPRSSPGIQMLYLFLVGIPMQATAAPISLADTPLYTFYADAPRVWGLTPLQDQQLGGLLMWVPGGLYLWGAISVVFLRWAKTEK